jgi:hypothetical protein
VLQLLLQNARSSDDNSLELVASDTPGSLFGSVVWDPYQDNEQLESLYYASQSSCQIGVEKVSLKSFVIGYRLDVTILKKYSYELLDSCMSLVTNYLL